ncbi:MAG: FtsW/RodA/SpoVE family cell cycle protein, partial [Planctomycetota bacterium]|nr:FtsW/RodA/SpoVE family cell cycle protein [Planctomycetota bacterium]
LVAEEWGLVGASLVLLLLFSLIFLGLSTALYAASEYGRLLALGASTLLFIQTSINVAMNLGLAPVTGIPLPFLTYGGSSMLLFWSVSASLSLVRLNDKPSMVEYCSGF